MWNPNSNTLPFRAIDIYVEAVIYAGDQDNALCKQWDCTQISRDIFPQIIRPMQDFAQRITWHLTVTQIFLIMMKVLLQVMGSEGEEIITVSHAVLHT